jgi:hypothetical protein
MARTFQIISPDRTISLINTGATGIIAEREGFGDVKLAPHQFDEGRDIDDLVVTERWKLNLRGSSHDDLATTARQFFEVLREAWKYHQNPRDTQPIYLKAQTTGETNPRYALVYMSQEVSQPDFYCSICVGGWDTGRCSRQCHNPRYCPRWRAFQPNHCAHCQYRGGSHSDYPYISRRWGSVQR